MTSKELGAPPIQLCCPAEPRAPCRERRGGSIALGVPGGRGLGAVPSTSLKGFWMCVASGFSGMGLMGTNDPFVFHPAGLRAGRPVRGGHLLRSQPVAAWAAGVHPTGVGRRGVLPRQPQGTAHTCSGHKATSQSRHWTAVF